MRERFGDWLPGPGENLESAGFPPSFEEAIHASVWSLRAPASGFSLPGTVHSPAIGDPEMELSQFCDLLCTRFDRRARTASSLARNPADCSRGRMILTRVIVAGVSAFVMIRPGGAPDGGWMVRPGGVLDGEWAVRLGACRRR